MNELKNMEQLILPFVGLDVKYIRGCMYNSNGRECTRYGEFKLWESFYRSSSGFNGYFCYCIDCHNKDNLKRKKERAYSEEVIEAWENLENKYSYGDIGPDGRIFHRYSKHRSMKNNFEVWLSVEQFQKLEDKKEFHRKQIEAIKDKRKRGEVNSEGMYFYGYVPSRPSFGYELWLTKDDFSRRLFNDGMAKYLYVSLDCHGGKDERRSEIIGLSEGELYDYIESQFVDGMSWDNRSEWHVDHILPLSAVDNLEDTKHLWYFENLRPMWGPENISKSNKHCPKQLEEYLTKRRAAK